MYSKLECLNNLMSIMKNIICNLLMIFSLLSVSCQMGLEDLPVFDEADIVSVNFETRWVDPSTNSFRVQSINIIDQDIDSDRNVITLKLSVPPPSSNFPEAVHNETSLTNLVMYCNISNAATIRPIGSSPTLGRLGDYSQHDIMYEVTAADGVHRKLWKIAISEFIK